MPKVLITNTFTDINNVKHVEFLKSVEFTSGNARHHFMHLTSTDKKEEALDLKEEDFAWALIKHIDLESFSKRNVYNFYVVQIS